MPDEPAGWIAFEGALADLAATRSTLTGKHLAALRRYLTAGAPFLALDGSLVRMIGRKPRRNVATGL